MFYCTFHYFSKQGELKNNINYSCYTGHLKFEHFSVENTLARTVDTQKEQVHDMVA